MFNITAHVKSRVAYWYALLPEIYSKSTSTILLNIYWHIDFVIYMHMMIRLDANAGVDS